MTKITFAKYDFKTLQTEQGMKVFDIIRKSYFLITPEEWVRQHILHYLVFDRKYPIGLIAVEKQFLVNEKKKRFDIVIYNRTTKPFILVECKAPSEKISLQVASQIASYNLTIQSPFFLITNGNQSLFIDLQNMQALPEIPIFKA